MKRSIITLAFLTLTLALAACGSSAANTGIVTTPVATQPQATSVPATPTNTPPPAHFKLKQTVVIGNIWQITITKAALTKGGQYDQPAAGTQYLVLSLAIKNVSSTEQTFYGPGYMTLRDPAGQAMNYSYVSSARTIPQGKVEAGGPLTGDLTYSVPVGVHAFTLSYELDVTTPGQTVWDINV